MSEHEQNGNENDIQNNKVVDIRISIAPTPNPNALKFILSIPVKTEGKSSYKSSSECGGNRLAKTLFNIKGVKSLHFFQNTITINKDEETSWEELEEYLVETLKIMAITHSPDYTDTDQEQERRKSLSPELQKIEAILDETIRPSLQMDGGDVICVEFKDHILFVKYQGACGSCPSSTSGTLMAIKSILQEKLEMDDLDVYPIPA